jgi:hypothetical protein
MHNGTGPNRDKSVLRKYGINIEPWRTTGDHILVATQSEAFYQHRMGISRSVWVTGLCATLGKYTDREIVVCHKPAVKDLAPDQAHNPSFEPLLKGSWAMVTHSSSAAVRAVCEGVPVFSDLEAMAAPLGNVDLSGVESPVLAGNREQWLANLLSNQWTYNEMRRGVCWRSLQEQYALPVVDLDRMYGLEREDRRIG